MASVKATHQRLKQTPWSRKLTSRLASLTAFHVYSNPKKADKRASATAVHTHKILIHQDRPMRLR